MKSDINAKNVQSQHGPTVTNLVAPTGKGIEVLDFSYITPRFHISDIPWNQGLTRKIPICNYGLNQYFFAPVKCHLTDRFLII